MIGLPNHGVLRVGDSLSESGAITFTGIPNFAPELLKRVRTADPLKQKHLRRALEGLAEEGVTQMFRPLIGSEMVVGAVGALQFEVLEERLKAEYQIEGPVRAFALSGRALDFRCARGCRGVRR